MPLHYQKSKDTYGLLAQGCPMCGAELSRIQRRPIDLVLNSFVPLVRVRCQNIRCQYEGNLRREFPQDR
jgi:hypothetical protein